MSSLLAFDHTQSPQADLGGVARVTDDIALTGITAQSCLLLQSATAAAFGVSLDEMQASSRRAANVAFARQSAMYLAHVTLGLTLSAVGILFRRDRTTAAHACKRVEDRRDDPAIDRLLQGLEDICSEFACAMSARPQVRS